MVDIQRARVVWSGFPGGPGISTHYFIDASLHMAALRDFYIVVATALPPDVTLTFPTSGDTISDQTGTLTGAWATAALAAVTGSGPANYNAAAGFQVKWASDSINAGKRLRGRTFMVPGAGGIYDGSGGVNGAVMSGVAAACATLIAAHPTNMVGWHRPFAGTPAWTDVHGKLHPARAAHNGQLGDIISGAVPHKPVVLTSRRD